MNEEEREIAERLQKGQLAFFAGSALSAGPPSNLPLGMELKNEFIWSLFPPDESITTRYRPYYGAIRYPSSNNQGEIDGGFLTRLKCLAPETVYQIAYDSPLENYRYVLEALRVLDTRYDGRAPNSNHFFLAKAMGSCRVPLVLTTNFDVLIEEALKIENMCYERHITEDEFSEKTKTGNGLPTLYKLHGTIEELGEEQFIATLFQVGQGLSPNKRRFLKRLLANFDVCFIGYSGYDLDISEVIRTATTDRRLFWLVKPHSSTQRVRWVLEGKDYRVIEQDIVAFFRHLGQMLSPRISLQVAREARDISYLEQFFVDWGASPQLDLFSRLYILSRIFQYIGEMNWAREAMGLLYDRIPDEGVRAVARAHLATIHLARGEFQKALDKAQSAQHSAEKEERTFLREYGQVVALRAQGETYQRLAFLHEQPEFRRLAIEYYQRCIDILHSTQNQRLRRQSGWFYLLIAKNLYALGYLDEARESFSRVHDSVERSGDCRLRGHLFRHEARFLLEVDPSRKDQCIDMCHKAGQIFENIGFQPGLADVSKDMASIYLASGDIENGRIYAMQAKDLYRKLRNVGGIRSIDKLMLSLHKR